MKRIVLTGGGTAGHVSPNIALIPGLKDLGYEISYIGSIEGIERTMIEKLGIPTTPSLRESFAGTLTLRISAIPSGL